VNIRINVGSSLRLIHVLGWTCMFEVSVGCTYLVRYTYIFEMNLRE